MQIKSKWTMRGHFKHLRFKTFLTVSWGPNLVFSTFLTKALNIHNSHTSATSKVGVHLGAIGLHPLHSPPFVRMCFTPKHTLNLMGPCIPHFVMNPMLGLWQTPWMTSICRTIIGTGTTSTNSIGYWELD
jgi:hypothetical protein